MSLILKGGDLEHQNIRVGRRMIHYSVTGSGPPLIFLHGFSGSMHWWEHNISYFAKHYRVFLIDLVGFGRSRRQPFALKKAADHLIEWMDWLGIDSASLIGHSMGGFICLDLAAKIPDRIRQLVLVDALSLPIQQSILQMSWDLIKSLRYTSASFIPVLFYDALRAGLKTLVVAIPQVLAANFSDRLEQVSAPKIIIWGEQDLLLPLEYGLQLAKALPECEFKVIPGAGHNPMWDRPAAFNKIVGDFLE